jgi:hypothetical protein
VTTLGDVAKSKLQLPSDYDSVVYIPLDPCGAWQLRLTREMKAVAFHRH